MEHLAEIIFLVPKSTLQAEILPLLLPLTPKLLDALQTSTNEGLVIRLAEVLSYVYSSTKSEDEIEREVETGLQHLKTVSCFFRFMMRPKT